MSLRLRLLLALGVAVIVALAAADIATYRSLHSFMLDRVDSQLRAVDRGLNGRGGPGDPGDGPGGPRGPGFDRGGPSDSDPADVAGGAYLEERDADGNIVGTPVPAHVPGGQELTPDLPSNVSALVGSSEHDDVFLSVSSAQADGQPFRIRVVRRSDGGVLIAGVPLGDTNATLSRLLALEFGVTAGALLVAIALGWWLLRVGLRPLRNVEATAAAIADGEFDRRVPGDDAPTEVGQLARALNTMLARIEEAFAERDETEDKLRRFVADASHELRTPLAAVSAYTEMFEHPGSKPTDRKRAMTNIRTETQRMGELVEDLMLLARLDEGRDITLRPIEIVSLVGEAVETSMTVGPQWPVHLHAAQPVDVLGDETRLRQVFDNLLSNVRAHTPEGTATDVHMSTTDDEVEIAFADQGPGLTDDQTEHIFERFYRADPSRSRQAGGSGLGLGIVAAIVGAHQGHVVASATPGHGTTITITLPRHH